MGAQDQLTVRDQAMVVRPIVGSSTPTANLTDLLIRLSWVPLHEIRELAEHGRFGPGADDLPDRLPACEQAYGRH